MHRSAEFVHVLGQLFLYGFTLATDRANCQNAGNNK